MSGSGSPGVTTIGSSPGCQRSMLSGGRAERGAAEKQARGLHRETVARRRRFQRNAAASGAAFRSSSGWASSDIDTSYCASGGALSASCSSGSSGGWSPAGAASAVFAPRTDAFEVEGSSSAGRTIRRAARPPAAERDQAVALQRAIDLGKIGRLIARRRLQHGVARQRAGDVETRVFEAGQTIERGLRRRGSDRAAEAVGGDLDGADGGEHPLLPALGDTGLPGQQRCDILISDFGRGQCEDAKTKAEERETRALRPVTHT